jgi:flagellar protein FlgJ
VSFSLFAAYCSPFTKDNAAQRQTADSFMDINHGFDAALLVRQANPVPRPAGSAGQQDPEKLKGLVQEFEAIFIQQMYKEMRNTIPDDGLMPRTNAEDTFVQMQDLEVAKATARQGGIGLAEMMMKQLQQID